MKEPARRLRIEACAEQENTPDKKLATSYKVVRQLSEQLCQPLEADDYAIQAMPDVSPPKWHLAHTTWFFETLLLKPFLPGYQEVSAQYGYLFNSYYYQIGTMHQRPRRGLLSRPTVDEIYQYRGHVDQHMSVLLDQRTHEENEEIRLRTEIGLHHEQQHQELFLTDLKYNFSLNPLRPAYCQVKSSPQSRGLAEGWEGNSGGLLEIGYQGDGFCYDNELPRHKVYLAPYKISWGLVTNGDYIEFINAGAYQQVEHWLSDAWQTVQTNNWVAPLYWELIDGAWWHMTLNGMQPVDENDPVCHVSYYEADAFARWRGKRLPTEAEWEQVAGKLKSDGNFLHNGFLRPLPASDDKNNNQFFGDVWEWTQSPYSPYPGYKPQQGALGEYNGKFMCNQFVLRGGSCVTPHDHIRASYRNFFYPKDRWQFSGIRLAEDGE